MITTLRKYFHKRALQVVVAITILSMLLADFARRSVKSSREANNVAQVDGQEISLQEFRAAILEEERKLEYIQALFGSESEYLLRAQGLSTNAQENAIRKLVQEKLMESIADKSGISISPEYIEDRLSDPSFLADLSFKLFGQLPFGAGNLPTKAQILHALKKTGIPVSKFEQIVENDLKREVLADIVAGASYAPESYLIDEFMRETRGRKFKILTFSLEQYLNNEKKQPITDEEAKKYFDAQNKAYKKYWNPETRDAIIYEFTPAGYGLKSTEDDLKKFAAQFRADSQKAINEYAKKADVINALATSKKAKKSDVQKLEASKVTGKGHLAKTFELRENQPGFVLDVKTGTPARGFIVLPTKINKAREPEFSSIASLVKNDIYKERAQRAMIIEAESANTQISADGIQEVIKKYNPLVKSIEFSKATEKEFKETLKKMEIPSPAVMALVHKNMHMFIPTNTNGYIIYVEDAKPINQDEFEKNKLEMAKASTSGIAQQLIHGFIANLLKTATIKYNPKFKPA